MLANYNMESSETLLLNLTETLLGDGLNQQTIYCENIGIMRRLSNLSFLYVDNASESDELTIESADNVSTLKRPYLETVVFGSIGASTVVILPQKISSMLAKGWSYQSRLALLWGAFKALKQKSNTSSVLRLPESSSPSQENEEFGVEDMLKPLGLEVENVGSNLLLYNPAYYPFLIAEEGMSQEEFRHVELYLRNGGNLILSVDQVVVDGEFNSQLCIDGDQICLNF